MDKLDIALLKKICETPGTSGFENAIRNVVIEAVKPLADEVSTDAIGNVIAFKKGKTNKKLMIPAHMDEIGFVVKYIDENGFLKVNPLGGFDPKTLTADEVKKNINVGDSVTRHQPLIEMGDCVNGKSLDNRISVYALIEMLKALEKPAYDTYAVFTTQEEIGLRGAFLAAHKINPDFCINLDTTVAFDCPGAKPEDAVTQLGEGAAIKIMDSTIICDYRMIAFMKSMAEKNKIKWQPEILDKGGTDTAAVQRLSVDGAICGAISLPTRNIHQSVEMVHKQDTINAIKLLLACANNIDKHNWEHS